MTMGKFIRNAIGSSACVCVGGGGSGKERVTGTLLMDGVPGEQDGAPQRLMMNIFVTERDHDVFLNCCVIVQN